VGHGSPSPFIRGGPDPDYASFLDGLAADEAVLDALLPPLNTSALDELLGDDSILDEMFRPIDEPMRGAPSQARRKKCRGGR
jgi:hypothetical protein